MIVYRVGFCGGLRLGVYIISYNNYYIILYVYITFADSAWIGTYRTKWRTTTICT